MRGIINGMVLDMCGIWYDRRCKTIWYGVWYGMVWYGMMWCDMVWYGVMWYGMVWYGMVWYGVMYVMV